MYIYEDDGLLESGICDPCLPVKHDPSDDHIIFVALADKHEEYYVIASIKNPDYKGIDSEKDGIFFRNYFYISMERPIFMKKPSRFLSVKEKSLLNHLADKYWNEIVSQIKACCNQCSQFGGCEKFRNRPIPLTHPDYTLLYERKDV